MITAEVSGARDAIQRIRQLTPALRRELKISLTRASLMLLAHVKADKLSGGVLNVKTGRLRRSINQLVKEDEKSVTGQVGTNVSYGRMWELGFERKLGAGTRGGPGARGGKVLTGKSLDSYNAKHPQGKKHEQRSFLASSLVEKRSEIVAEINEALKRALKK
jgi:hypothetical protein